jgi:hypothetical protein
MAILLLVLVLDDSLEIGQAGLDPADERPLTSADDRDDNGRARR